MIFGHYSVQQHQKGNSMRKLFNLISCVALVLVFTETSAALPRFALMAGAKCASCHVNPTGGQIRTEYGTTFSINTLPIRPNIAEENTEGDGDDFIFNPKISENITVGGDFRSQFIYDPEGQTSSFHLMTMSLYGTVNLSKKISFTYKQDIANPTYNLFSGPEIFAVAKVLPENWYIKAGNFLPDYGLRLDDHTAFTRGGDLGFFFPYMHRGLLFLPNYKDIGVEIGGYVGGLFLTTGLFNGTGNNTKLFFEKDKAYTAKLEYMGAVQSLNYRVGISGYGFRRYKMGGFHIGLGTGDVQVMGELDVTHNGLDPYALPVPVDITSNNHMMAAYGEIDIRAVQGLWIIGKYDVFDPARGVSDDEIKRMTIGLEYFPWPFIELRPQFRFNLETPSVDNNLGLVQIHVWF
jgi:hypothetical protein